MSTRRMILLRRLNTLLSPTVTASQQSTLGNHVPVLHLLQLHPPLLTSMRVDLLFAKTSRFCDLAKANANLLEGAAADVVQAPVKGFVKGLYLSSDELVLALAKRRSVLFFSAKALEQKVHSIMMGGWFLHRTASLLITLLLWVNVTREESGTTRQGAHLCLQGRDGSPTLVASDRTQSAPCAQLHGQSDPRRLGNPTIIVSMPLHEGHPPRARVSGSTDLCVVLSF